jgi:hypothetical protein
VIRKNIIRSALVGGIHTSPLSITTSIIFSLLSFFYVYTVGSYLKIKIVYLQDRVTYDAPFSNIYIINQYVDHIILASGTVLWLILSIKEKKARWLVSSIYGGLTIISAAGNINNVLDVLASLSIPIILACWAYGVYSRSLKEKARNFLNHDVNLLAVNYISIIGIITAIASIVLTIMIHFWSVSPQSTVIRNYSYDIFFLLGNFSPFLIFLLIISFPVKILINEFVTRKITRKKSNMSNNINNIGNTNKTYKRNNNNNNHSILDNSFRSNSDYVVKRKKIIYLILFMILSIVIALFPHQPTINKNNQQIGIDTKAYIDWLNPLISSNNFQEFTQHAPSVLLQSQQAADRPLSILFLFGIVKLANNSDISYIVEHVPVILSPALVLVTYFLTRELTSNDTSSLLAAFITAISYHVLIGVYAGYYANWFALILGYLSIAFLIRFLKGSAGKNNKSNFILFLTLVVLSQLAHVYTWSVLTLVMAIFLAAMLKLKYYNKRKVVLTLLSIVCLIIVDIAILTIWSSGAIERELKIARQVEGGLQDFAKRWGNLVYVTQIYFIGLFGNFIILSLGLYWLYRCNLREQSTIFLIIFLSTGFIPLFFGDVLFITRSFYNIAFQIPAAIALSYMRQYKYGGNMLVVSTCVWLLAISIRTVSNFVGPL